MKATGIVRRIDDLGRIVIPKEIRRTMRIREGDPLEIFVNEQGDIMLKKYSPIGELGDFALQYAESLNKASGHVTCIADGDSIIAVSGASKKEFLEKQLSPKVEEIISERKTFMNQSSDDKFSIIADSDTSSKYYSQVITPIISQGDTVGAVIMLSSDPHFNMGEVETKLTQSAAGFLGKHLEQ